MDEGSTHLTERKRNTKHKGKHTTFSSFPSSFSLITMDWAEVKEAWIKLNEERKERGVVVEWKKKNGTNHASLYYHCVRSFFFIHSSHHSSFLSFIWLVCNGRMKHETSQIKEEKNVVCSFFISFVFKLNTILFLFVLGVFNLKQKKEEGNERNKKWTRTKNKACVHFTPLIFVLFTCFFLFISFTHFQPYDLLLVVVRSSLCFSLIKFTHFRL